LTVIVFIIVFFKSSKNGVSKNLVASPNINNSYLKYDDNTKLYYIEDEENGEIIFASYDKDDVMFNFYKENPNYNPNPLISRKTRLEEFIVSEASNIESMEENK